MVEEFSEEFSDLIVESVPIRFPVHAGDDDTIRICHEERYPVPEDGFVARFCERKD